eukprot:262284-Pleurochrysis_carterae.AAC.6
MSLRADGICRVRQTPQFVSYDKQVFRGAVFETNEHWTARLAVHVWDRLELSRAKMESLRLSSH